MESDFTQLLKSLSLVPENVPKVIRLNGKHSSINVPKSASHEFSK